MRNAFAKELTSLFAKDERLVLLSGDIGNKLFDELKGSFPKRFFNCGVAEANMASVAAGMAMCGLKPITYTIASFNTTRCLEQIRVDICYHNLPVIVVGVGAGLAYASNGCTHHSCEDLSFLRSIPNMTVVCPGDALELQALLRQSVKHPGPLYLRMGKKGDPKVFETMPEVTIGKGHVIRKGVEIALIATGNMLYDAVQVGNHLNAEVISMHTVKPLDEELLAQVFRNFPLVVSLEEHSLIGGLGSAIAEWLVDNKVPYSSFLRLGTRDEFPHLLGEQSYIREHFGLSIDQITNRIEQCVQKLPSS